MSDTKSYKDIFQEYIDLGITEDEIQTIIQEYNIYIGPLIHKMFHQRIDFDNIYLCHMHRQEMLVHNKRPPCHACKYVKRSMNILTDYMFIEKRVATEDRISFLLRSSFSDKLRTTRVNHMRLLASNIASMGNIMFSCADSPIFSFDTVKYIISMLESSSDDYKDSTTHIYINIQWKDIGKIDKALLYYLVAFRFYIIAKLDKDACDCLLKILIVINNALTVVKSNLKSKLDTTEQKDSDKFIVSNESYKQLKGLFDTLFTRYAKLVNRQSAYSGHSEVQSIRDMLHMHKEEDINLTRSHLYSDLVEAIWHIIDSEIKMLELIKIKSTSEDINKERIKIITDAYNHFKYIGMPHNTFYSEVIFYFARYNINNYILKDLLNGSKEEKLEIKFLEDYFNYIQPNRKCSLYKSFYNVGDTKSKQNFVEFLIEDSIICLSEILYILTPFNHISSFSNNFVAGIYNSLWEYAKMYETLGLLYDFKKYENSDVYEYKLFNYWIKTNSSRNKQFQDKIRQCSNLISDAANLRDKYGSLRNRLFTRLKHNIDDRTFKYTISNYAAEMALRYYSLVESGYYEGSAYRNQVSRNYLLNDDLDNDTWLFNTAIERFRINTNDIKRRKQTLVKANRDSRFYRYESYVMEKNQETEQFDFFDDIRFEDSLFTNTEL
ncbi:MAG: hypothetical protein IKV77_00440 [Alistipes sp.]|nr:hypothetical protein [Alistipes sp.]